MKISRKLMQAVLPASWGGSPASRPRTRDRYFRTEPCRVLPPERLIAGQSDKGGLVMFALPNQIILAMPESETSIGNAKQSVGWKSMFWKQLYLYQVGAASTWSESEMKISRKLQAALPASGAEANFRPENQRSAFPLATLCACLHELGWSIHEKGEI